MTKLSITLLVVTMLVGSASLYGNSIFNTADSFNHALDRAQTKRKLLLTYAASASSPCCIAMDKATFKNPKIQNFLKASFYPIKINLSNALGQRWANRFQIVTAPTLLFFDTHGTLIKQVENGISSSELKAILEEVLFYNENGFWPMEESQPVVLTAYVPNHPTITSPTPNSVYSCPIKSGQIRKEKTADSNLIQILLDQVPTNDPSIKLAIKEAKLKFPQHLITIKLIKENQMSYYQIWVGEFSQIPEAQVLLDALQEEGFDDAQLISTEKKMP